ncbi:MAG: hypothetical protein K8E24_012895 [Methanobacterium paludis]|nr:hypothetical protein [Methanobacterium paludis]
MDNNGMYRCFCGGLYEPVNCWVEEDGSVRFFAVCGNCEDIQYITKDKVKGGNVNKMNKKEFCSKCGVPMVLMSSSPVKDKHFGTGKHYIFKCNSCGTGRSYNQFGNMFKDFETIRTDKLPTLKYNGEGEEDIVDLEYITVYDKNGKHRYLKDDFYKKKGIGGLKEPTSIKIPNNTTTKNYNKPKKLLDDRGAQRTGERMRVKSKKKLNKTCKSCGKDVEPTQRFIYGNHDGLLDYFILDCGHLDVVHYDNGVLYPSDNENIDKIYPFRDIKEYPYEIKDTPYEILEPLL